MTTWGSTTAGALFTGSKSWQAQAVNGKDLVLTEDFSKVIFKINLAQLWEVRVEPGTMWATCHFTYLEGSSTRSHEVDGVPNKTALEMKVALEQLVVRSLAEFVQTNSRQLKAFHLQAINGLELKPGVIVTDDQIKKLLRASSPPKTPGQVPVDSLLFHPLSGQAKRLVETWPTWDYGTEQTLCSIASKHNKEIYTEKINSWIDRLSVAMGIDKWIPKSHPERLLKKTPPPSDVPAHDWRSLTGFATPQETAVGIANELNALHTAKKIEARKHFFDTVEKNPLTDEQVKACICMDPHVLVVAAAGSGKTSTMVAKTGYVLSEGLATPDQILLLAFNRAAADELTDRVRTRLKSIPNIDKVQSNTFHAFGIEVIAKATGKKPSLAPWVSPDNPGADVREIANIIEHLSEKDKKFKRTWDLFRTVYGRDIGKFGASPTPDSYENGRSGFRTAKGEIVKSAEERVIADWLFYHGVNYRYEARYEHDTANETHRQYHPDFYYPEIKLYHEHFALDEQGEAPAHFKDYMGGVAWKRSIHAQMGTALFESTSHGINTGDSFHELNAELVARGLKPKFDPDREATGQEPIPAKELARSFRVFQQHVKNNNLSKADLRRALKTCSEDGFAARLRMYLDLYERIAAEWEQRLKDGGYIDFEDMLNLAVSHVETGKFKSPFTVILGDEFQDSSRARIRLLAALTKNPGVPVHLFVVGDDWQGINRFAGADITVMTEFEKTFSDATRMTLSTTFRCPQAICDASSHFIQQNPVQIKKTVRTTNTLNKTPLLGFAFKHKAGIAQHIEDQLAKMHQYASTGKLKPDNGSHITVMILGRYRDDKPAALSKWQSDFGSHLKISFSTVHGSKGLEADYVFLVNVTQGIRGFPSQIQDDPVLQMAMPEPETYPDAEERRLFYVALTRARRQIRLYTTTGQPSSFLTELVKSEHLQVESVDGEKQAVCPACSKGFLSLRQSDRGPFYGCTSFPACNYTEDAPDERKSVSRAAPHSKQTPQRRKTAPSTKIKTGQAGDQCPVCRRGILRVMNGKNGSFLGCNAFPKCRAKAELT